MIACLFAGTLISCQDDPPAPPPEPTLPPITQTGENTFGCRIDGEVWLRGGSGFAPILSADFYHNGINILAANYSGNLDHYVRLSFGRVWSDTTFSISNYTSSSDFQYFEYILSDDNTSV